MKKDKYTIAITGASGLVGRNLVQYFSQKGWAIRCLQRKPAFIDNKNVSFYKFQLQNLIAEDAFQGTDVLIHCAMQEYNLKNPNADIVNMEGTKALLRLSRKHHVKFIFLSTLSAHEDAESHYGKNKYDIEQIFDLEKDLVLRLGLVMANGGLFSNIVDIVKKSKFIPLVDNGKQPIQTICVNDLCQVFERAIMRGIVGKYNIAELSAKSMKDLYQQVSQSLGVKRHFISVPFWFIKYVIAVIEKLKIPFGITIENLLGLKHLRAFETADDMKKFGIQLKTMNQSVQTLLNQ